MPQFDSLQQEVFLNLWRTYDSLKALEDELFVKFQLSAQQYNALRLLGGVFPNSIPTLKLGRKLISRAPDMTRMLDKLEQRELIRRDRPADNRRVVNVVITDKGLALLSELAPAVNKMHESQLGHLSESQSRQLIRLLVAARTPHVKDSPTWLEERT